MKTMEDLTGKLLIASPTTTPDSYFAKSLIYIVKYDSTGAMGVIVNFPLITLNGNVIVNTNSHDRENIYLKNLKTYSGGPVEMEKGFILQLEETEEESKDIIKISSSIEVLKSLSKNSQHKNTMFLFGYCGWEAGQLEKELENNDWLIAPTTKRIIFNTNNKKKWHQALENLRVNPSQYSSYTGSC